MLLFAYNKSQQIFDNAHETCSWLRLKRKRKNTSACICNNLFMWITKKKLKNDWQFFVLFCFCFFVFLFFVFVFVVFFFFKTSSNHWRQTKRNSSIKLCSNLGKKWSRTLVQFLSFALKDGRDKDGKKTGKDWDGLHLGKFKKRRPIFFSYLYQFKSKCHLNSWKIILSRYVAMILKIKNSCSADLTFRALN